MIGIAFTAFRLLPGLAQLAILGVLLASLAGTYALWHHKIYTRGYDAAIADIADENQEAVDAANTLRKKRRDCIAGSGVWDTTVGLCR